MSPAYGSPAAGDVGKKISGQTQKVQREKTRISAGSSLVFNDLAQLALESEANLAINDLFLLAQRFLFALPSPIPAPELSIDCDGEVVFDWHSRDGKKMMTIALGFDGRLSYAARFSGQDKDFGLKRFEDEIPKIVIELVRRVALD